MQNRFSDLESFYFFALLDSSKFIDHKTYFPDLLCSNLLKTYGSNFDSIRLKNELSVVYSSLHQDFQGKSVSEIVKIMNERDLVWAMPEIYKLACLILTVPSTTASVERSFSTLNRVKSHCRSTMGQERLSSLSMMSIEKQLLCTLRKDDHENFTQAVLEQFLKKSCRMELSFQ